MKKLIVLDSMPVEYDLQVKNVKRINLRVHRDGRVSVSVNRYVTQSQIEAFLVQNTDFILQAMEKFRRMREAGDGMSTGRHREFEDGDIVYLKGTANRLRVLESRKESVEQVGNVLLLTQKDAGDSARRARMMDKFLKEKCMEDVERISRQVYPTFERMGVQWPEIKVRNMVSRWGSCQPSRRVLTFARQLVEVPEACMEYVVVHEFAHFIQPNHSPKFHDLMTGVMPDWKGRRNLLNSRSWIEQ